jgi:hypothetical protein
LREQVTTARAHVARLGGRLARARHALKD